MFRHLFAFISIILLALGCGGTSATSPRDDGGSGEPAAPDITGRWASECVSANGQNLTLEFDIEAAQWQLDYATFADASCEQPFFTVRIAGPWTLQQPSPEVSGAWEAEFGFAEKSVTPHVQAAAEFLASEQGCGREGFAVGEASDIYASGCAGLLQYPRAQCQADYDLVALVDGNLQFGARPTDNDMCTPQKRPTRLSGMPLMRS